MELNTVVSEIKGKVGIITLNRPKALNAVSEEMLRELTSQTKAFDEDPWVRAIIIRGSDKAFAAGIDAGCGAVLVSHNIVQALDGNYPASLSPAVHQYLRDTMGFDGVVMTDDLVMEAITDRYGTGEAAVLAVQAGNDLLCSTDYAEQYNAVLSAVLDGRIDFDALNASVTRILKWKQNLGLL